MSDDKQRDDVQAARKSVEIATDKAAGNLLELIDSDDPLVRAIASYAVVSERDAVLFILTRKAKGDTGDWDKEE